MKTIISLIRVTAFATFLSTIIMTDILVVDDHVLIRKGLKILLEECPEFQVTGEADTGALAIRMLRERHFDMVLLDISLPDKHGMEVLNMIKLEHPDIKIIVLSMY
ncbi:MAG: response regulator transcription factor, partial [Gallionella sp.]